MTRGANYSSSGGSIDSGHQKLKVDEALLYNSAISAAEAQSSQPFRIRLLQGGFPSTSLLTPLRPAPLGMGSVGWKSENLRCFYGGTPLRSLQSSSQEVT